jgi:hypothetical protein
VLQRPRCQEFASDFETLLNFGHLDMEGQHPSDMHAIKNEGEIRRYLLGDPSLGDDQRAIIEDAYFGDDVMHATLLEMEDELVDGYVFGELTSQERTWFEDGLRQSERRREKVELTKSLVRYASRTSPEAVGTRPFQWLRVLGISAMPPAWRLGVACAVILLLAGSLRLLYTFRSNEIELRPSQIAVNKPTSAPAAVPPVVRHQSFPDQSARKAAGPAVLAFILAPDLTRGNGEMTSVKIPNGDYTVRLRMGRAGESYTRYAATLVTAERRLVASKTNLFVRHVGATRTVVFTLRSDRLVPGVYILSLKGRTVGKAPDELDDYTFQVVNP